MSYRAMDWAASVDVETSQQRLCLMLLAWHMSERTGECFPSQALLAKEAHISLRAVQYALSQLEQKNLITRRAEKDERGVIVRTLYAMSIPNRVSQGVHDVSHTVRGGVAQGAGGCRTDCTGVSHTVRGGVAQGACKQGIEQGIKQGTEQGIEAPSPPPARRKEHKPLTNTFDIQELPPEWKSYCEEVRPDLDPDKVFADFRFYWASGRGSGTRRSDKGWNQSWQTWVRKEKENGRNSKQTPENQDLLDINSVHFTKEYYSGYEQ